MDRLGSSLAVKTRLSAGVSQYLLQKTQKNTTTVPQTQVMPRGDPCEDSIFIGATNVPKAGQFSAVSTSFILDADKLDGYAAKYGADKSVVIGNAVGVFIQNSGSLATLSCIKCGATGKLRNHGWANATHRMVCHCNATFASHELLPQILQYRSAVRPLAFHGTLNRNIWRDFPGNEAADATFPFFVLLPGDAPGGDISMDGDIAGDTAVISSAADGSEFASSDADGAVSVSEGSAMMTDDSGSVDGSAAGSICASVAVSGSDSDSAVSSYCPSVDPDVVAELKTENARLEARCQKATDISRNLYATFQTERQEWLQEREKLTSLHQTLAVEVQALRAQLQATVTPPGNPGGTIPVASSSEVAELKTIVAELSQQVSLLLTTGTVRPLSPAGAPPANAEIIELRGIVTDLSKRVAELIAVTRVSRETSSHPSCAAHKDVIAAGSSFVDPTPHVAFEVTTGAAGAPPRVPTAGPTAASPVGLTAAGTGSPPGASLAGFNAAGTSAPAGASAVGYNAAGSPSNTRSQIISSTTSLAGPQTYAQIVASPLPAEVWVNSNVDLTTAAGRNRAKTILDSVQALTGPNIPAAPRPPQGNAHVVFLYLEGFKNQPIKIIRQKLQGILPHYALLNVAWQGHLIEIATTNLDSRLITSTLQALLPSVTVVESTPFTPITKRLFDSPDGGVAAAKTLAINRLCGSMLRRGCPAIFKNFLPDLFAKVGAAEAFTSRLKELEAGSQTAARTRAIVRDTGIGGTAARRTRATGRETAVGLSPAGRVAADMEIDPLPTISEPCACPVSSLVPSSMLGQGNNK